MLAPRVEDVLIVAKNVVERGAAHVIPQLSLRPSVHRNIMLQL
jgi:hypothetical protein